MSLQCYDPVHGLTRGDIVLPSETYNQALQRITARKAGSTTKKTSNPNQKAETEAAQSKPSQFQFFVLRFAEDSMAGWFYEGAV